MFAVLAEFGFDGLQIEFKPVERKITSRHGVDNRPLSERLKENCCIAPEIIIIGGEVLRPPPRRPRTTSCIRWALARGSED